MQVRWQGRWALAVCVVAWAAVGCDDGPAAADLDAGAMMDGAAPDGALADTGPAPDRGPAPDLGPDAGPPQRRARFEPMGAGFFDTPWPSDARLTAEGTPDLAGFPGERASFQAIRDELQAHVRGFATMPIVYVAFEDPIDDAALPTPAASVAALSPVQLLALGEACGERVPVEIAVRVDAGRFRPAHTLQVKNTVGTVLRPGQAYGLVVRRSFGAEAGPATTAAPAFEAAWAGDGTAVSATLQPLKACWTQLGLDAAEVAIATVFTPQDPVDELRRLRAVVMDVDATPTRPPVGFGRDGAWSRRRLNIETWSGTIEMPVFQVGEPPYTSEGGAFVFDAAGTPLIQRWEPVPVMLAWRTGEAVAGLEGDRPVLVFQDGTGWTRWGHLRGRFMNEVLDEGVVIASFMPQFHGGRAGVEVDPELPTFNFLNPPAGRTNFRQQAVENSFFTRVIREQLAGLPGLPPLDTTRLVYGGHSQGAVTGALTAAVESAYAGYVFNGLSAYLTLTILERDDIIDFELVVRGLLGSAEPLDLFSPALHLIQVGSEAVDPHNFAHLWRGSEALPEGNHVFVTNGFTDDTTTPRGMDHLTLTAALPTFDPPGWDIDPLGVGLPPTVQVPVAGNAQALSGRPLTLATYLDPTSGHGTLYGVTALREMARGFWRDARAGRVPRLQASTEWMCGDAGDGDEDGAVDCADADCVAREPCVETRCGDEGDGDGDGLVDCDDPDCAGSSACQERACDDGEDNDGNGVADCDDPACAAVEPCAEVACRDREDGDGDGLVDCDDPDCAGTVACRETSCTDGEDNNRDGLTDCDDPACAGHLGCPEPACDDGTDEDGDGWADCADPRCFDAEGCGRAAEAACDDGADDDADGLTDCDDPDCALACAAVECGDGSLGEAVGVGVFQGTLEAAADGWAPGDCTPLGTGEGARDLALWWTAPADGDYVISTLGSEADTVLQVFGGCGEAIALGCHDDQPGVTSSAIRLTTQAGRTVLIVVSGYSDADVGAVRLHVLPVVGG